MGTMGAERVEDRLMVEKVLCWGLADELGKSQGTVARLARGSSGFGLLLKVEKREAIACSGLRVDVLFSGGTGIEVAISRAALFSVSVRFGA